MRSPAHMLPLIVALALGGASCVSVSVETVRSREATMAYVLGAMVADMEREEGQMLLYGAGDPGAPMRLDDETFLPRLPVQVGPRDRWMHEFIRGHNDRTKYNLRKLPTSRPVSADMV